MGQHAQERYSTLETRRCNEEEKLESNIHLVGSKHKVMEELLERYRDNQILESKIAVCFEEEDTSGDGLVRELYSLFWETFISQNCEGSSQFTVCVSPHLSTEDYTAVGRIIYFFSVEHSQLN